MMEFKQQLVHNMHFFDINYAVRMRETIKELNRIAQECPETSQEVVNFLEQLNQTAKKVWLQRMEKELYGGKSDV